VSDGAIRGCVVECYGRRVLVVHDAGAPLSCKVRGRKLDVVAGDEVLIEKHQGSDDWTVGERLARRNVLCRSDSRGLEESIAANLDQLGVVVAPLPACDAFVVDRYVAGACLAGIAPLLIVNKLDLPSDAGDLSYIEPLRKLGLPVHFVSARSGTGLPELILALTGKRTLLAGQSGVGKSSLLNALAGDAIRAIGRLSERSGEGRHTTVSSAIIRQSWGELADSPGVRDYTPAVVPPQDVQRGFMEIGGLAGGCRFQDCLHLREPQCAVQAAVASGAIDPRRYESYRRLLNLNRQLDDKRGWRA
jgi:ribosome biogenesis GTPase